MALHGYNAGREAADGGGVMSEFFRPTLGQSSAAAAVAARWWSDRLRESAGVAAAPPMFDAAGLARGSIDKAVMMDFFSQKIREKSGVTADHCDRFEKLLGESILDYIYNVDCRNCWRDCRGFDDGGPDAYLTVDYHPCEMLLTAMRAADVSKNMAEMFGLPHKTDMRASARRIEVSHGYGSPWVEIYGPLWGCTREEYDTHDARRRQANLEYYTWLQTLSHEERDRVDPVLSFSCPVWQGPV